jgi:uracil-DNA glycosylase family 4
MRALTLLNDHITHCTACSRLVTYREAVAAEKRKQFEDWTYWGRPVPGFGDAHARLYVLGLAPAAHGGNRTGRVFTGDRSGDWLFDALHRFGFANQPNSHHRDDGLKLLDCYIGATVRCAPPDNKPAPEEFMACRPYLREEIRSLRKIRVVVLPWGITLIGSYHPSQQNTFTGLLTRPMFHHIFATARQRIAEPPGARDDR